MKKIVSLLSILLLSQGVLAQTAAGSDIFISDLTSNQKGIQIGPLQNITQRPGYDNQPYFLTNDVLLFTAQLGEQTDILSYHFTTHKKQNITNSKVSEYSPTPMLNGSEFSVIYAENGNQQLWAYQLDGQAKRPLIQQDFKIGYHAWIDANQALITVLQENFMNLQIADVKNTSAKIVHPKTGASLFAIPGSDDFSFNTAINGQHWLMQLDVKSGNKQQLVELPADANYYTWTPDGKVLVASQTQLWFWDSKQADAKLTPFADIQAECPGGASRMAVNPKQTRLAVVCHGEAL